MTRIRQDSYLVIRYTTFLRRLAGGSIVVKIRRNSAMLVHDLSRDVIKSLEK